MFLSGLEGGSPELAERPWDSQSHRPPPKVYRASPDPTSLSSWRWIRPQPAQPGDFAPFAARIHCYDGGSKMDWDFIVIGSGFGGSVSALRLTEKGYRVLVLEKGRRLRTGDFPKTSWNLKKFFWLPQVGFRGLFKMTFLGHVTALSVVGVA